MENKEKLLALFKSYGISPLVVPTSEPTADQLKGRTGIRGYRILGE